MKNKEPYSTRVLNKPTLEYAKDTVAYMQISPVLLYGLIAVLASLGLFIFSFVDINQKIGFLIFLSGILATVVARWKLQTNFGLYLAGPAIACVIAGMAFWLFKSGSWLWIPAMLTIGWVIWKFIVYSKALSAYENSLGMGKHSGCNIAFFRPFDERYAEWARNLIIPLLKSYGDVEHVHDEFFKESETRGVLSIAYKQRAKDVLSRMDQYEEDERNLIEKTQSLIGSDLLFGTKFDDVDWKDGVLKILGRTDIAVVDVSTVSENVLWELKNCFRILPPIRVILVASLDAIEYLKEHETALLKTMHDSGILERLLVLPYHPSIPFSFADELHKRMIKIVGKKDYIKQNL